MKKVKVPFSVRVNPDHLKLAAQKNIDLAPVVQMAIAEAVEPDKCPTCGQSLVTRKKK